MTDPRQWRIAVAIGLEQMLDWAEWAAGWTTPCVCMPYRGSDGYPSRLYHDDRCVTHEAMDERRIPSHGLARDHYRKGRAQPVTAPWDADAYRADCERRGVEPGPMPKRVGKALVLTLEGGRIDWGMSSDVMWLRVAGMSAEPWKKGWDIRGCGAIDDFALLHTLARAITEAIKDPP